MFLIFCWIKPALRLPLHACHTLKMEMEIRMKQRYKEKVEEIILNQRKIGKGGLDEKKGRENS